MPQDKTTQGPASTPRRPRPPTAAEAAAASAAQQEEWSEPKPAVLPRPTYAPAILALGIVFFVWGLIYSPILSAVGVLLMIVALVGWIRSILAGHREEAAHGARQHG